MILAERLEARAREVERARLPRQLSSGSDSGSESDDAPLAARRTQLAKSAKSAKSAMSGAAPDAPRRSHGPSAYNLFVKDEVQRLKAADPSLDHRAIFSRATAAWSVLSAEEKGAYERAKATGGTATAAASSAAASSSAAATSAAPSSSTAASSSAADPVPTPRTLPPFIELDFLEGTAEAERRRVDPRALAFRGTYRLTDRVVNQRPTWQHTERSSQWVAWADVQTGAKDVWFAQGEHRLG